jgi:hypothetical protein
LVIKTSLCYDARSEKYQITSWYSLDGACRRFQLQEVRPKQSLCIVKAENNRHLVISRIHCSTIKRQITRTVLLFLYSLFYGQPFAMPDTILLSWYPRATYSRKWQQLSVPPMFKIFTDLQHNYYLSRLKAYLLDQMHL